MPLGFRRRGKSRVWLKDNSWWLAIVEFQPSGWSKGSYLNVAAMWLWHPRPHLVFDECERAAGFAPFEDVESFSVAANALGQRAAVESSRNLVRFSSIDAAAYYLAAKATTDPRQRYHSMMAALATGELEAARAQQATLMGASHSVAWFTDLQAKAESVIQAATILPARDVVTAEIQSTREMLKLPAVSSATLWA